jgi:hypothetical protein
LQVKNAFQNMKESGSKNNLITIRTRWGAIYLDKVSKIDQENLSKDTFEDYKIFILKLTKGETSKMVLISFSSEYMLKNEIYPLIECDKVFMFDNLDSLDIQKVLDETFKN